MKKVKLYADWSKYTWAFLPSVNYVNGIRSHEVQILWLGFGIFVNYIKPKKPAPRRIKPLAKDPSSR